MSFIHFSFLRIQAHHEPQRKRASQRRKKENESTEERKRTNEETKEEMKNAWNVV